MSDEPTLVNRLHARAGSSDFGTPAADRRLHREAADRIEELEAKNAEHRDCRGVAFLESELAAQDRHIAELEAKVEWWENRYELVAIRIAEHATRIAELEAELEVEQMERSQAELEADEARARIAELEAEGEQAVNAWMAALNSYRARIAELEAENAQLLTDTAEPVCCCNVGHR